MTSPSRSIPLMRNPRVLRGLAQIAFAVGAVYLLAAMANNMLTELERRDLPLGMGFLEQPAGFTIAETVIPYSDSDSYWRAFLAGIANTLLVSLLGIAAATVLGVIIGVSRLSGNFLVRTLAGGYVETIRNIPLLVQLFVWYTVVFLNLPLLRQSLTLPGGFYLNNRGVYFPWPGATGETGFWLGMTGIVAGMGLVAAWRLARRRRREGKPAKLPALGAAIVAGSVAFVLIAAAFTDFPPFAWESPVLKGFNFRGGGRVSPEFAALLTGLTLYTAAFIAEVVRAGIQAVGRGQSEAAAALGLSRFQALRHIVLPQALRVIIPPLVNQYLNLTKNSSLAVAIAFPDLVAVGNTIINQSGNAVQMMLLIMGAYVTMSLAISGLLNGFNRRFHPAGS